jgi:hypothetical protein
MRRTVSAEMLSTTPLVTSWRAISWQSHCDSERPSLSGNSQAILTAWRATAGGKNRRATGAGSIQQPLKPMLLKASPPLPDHPALILHLPGRGGDRMPFGQQQDNPSPVNQPSGRRSAAPDGFQLQLLLEGKLDAHRRFSSSHDTSSGLGFQGECYCTP